MGNYSESISIERLKMNAFIRTERLNMNSFIRIERINMNAFNRIERLNINAFVRIERFILITYLIAHELTKQYLKNLSHFNAILMNNDQQIKNNHKKGI